MRSRRLASPSQRLRELREQTEDQNRYVDTCLVLRRKKNQETILWAGGEWDRFDRQLTDRDPSSAVIVDINESQVAFTRWFAKWLRDFREGFPRDVSLALAGGNRRGGKTFNLIMCATAVVVDVPGSIGWTVINTYRERDEVERTLTDWFPSEWYHHRKAPDYVFEWINGSDTFIKSADDEEALKAGRADVVLLNEAQKLKVKTLANSLGGTIDKGGIGLLAANPPQTHRGEWVLELKEAIEEERIVGAKFFGFSAKDNTEIDQGARKRFSGILEVIDPSTHEGDAEGEWRAVGNIAYRFERAQVVKAAPTLGAITTKELQRRLGRPYSRLAGVDFQANPFVAAVWIEIYFSPTGHIYHVVDELRLRGTEDEFLDEVERRGYTRDRLAWIGDASGSWQDNEHTKGGRSFDIFKRRQWRIEPPQKKLTDKGQHASNPRPVSNRIGLVNDLFVEKRLVVDPRCEATIQALKKCERRNDEPYGIYAHLTDALGYVLWFLEGRRKPKIVSGGNEAAVAWSVGDARPTPKL